LDNQTLVRETKALRLAPGMGKDWDPAPVLQWEVIPRDSEDSKEST
jgi:hypothetical protein